MILIRIIYDNYKYHVIGICKFNIKEGGNHMTTGEKIKKARIRLGMTQQLLAEEIGTDQASISRMEADKRGVTDAQKRKLADLFREDIKTLFYETEK